MNSVNVLIVEDNILNAELAIKLLTDEGLSVVHKTTAEEAIAEAKENQPALILMDMNLPGINGYEATRILKQNAETQHIKVIAFTAMALNDEVEAAKEAGCTEVIFKPIDVLTFADFVLKELSITSGNKVVTKNLINPDESTHSKKSSRKIAHDIKNHLASIQSGITIINSQLQDNTYILEITAEMDKSRKGIQTLLNELLSLKVKND